MQLKIVNLKRKTARWKWSVFIMTISIVSCSKNNGPSNYEYMPDMYRSVSYKPYSTSNFFPDGMSSRNPVKGTIARGQLSYVYPFPNTIEGYEMAGDSLRNPILLNKQTLAEGKKLFETFCIHCHGQKGEGDGTMVKNEKYPAPPSYTKQLKNLPEGKMFHSITFGKNLMGSHSSQLMPEERWKIIHHIQTLQNAN